MNFKQHNFIASKLSFSGQLSPSNTPDIFVFLNRNELSVTSIY